MSAHAKFIKQPTLQTKCLHNSSENETIKNTCRLTTKPILIASCTKKKTVFAPVRGYVQIICVNSSGRRVRRHQW